MTNTPENVPTKRYADPEIEPVGTDVTPTTDPTAELDADATELTGEDD